MTAPARCSTWLVVFAVASCLAACGSEETLPPAPTDTPDAVPAPKAPEPVRVGELPSNLPEDVPHYAESEVAFSRAGGDMSVTVRLWSDDGIDDVSAFYSDELAAKGWATETRELPDGTFIVADKEGRKLLLSFATGEDERTQVDLYLSGAM